MSKKHTSDHETALVETINGDLEEYVLRYASVSDLNHERCDDAVEPCPIDLNRMSANDAFCLEIPKSKFIADLRWIPDRSIHPESLLPTDIVVKVHCVGLIFRDLLQVQGLYPSSYAFASDSSERDDYVGLEFAGTVVCQGNEAKQTYALGDRVFGIVSRQGAFRSHLLLNMVNVVKAPDGFSMEELASLPIAFLTVLLALKEGARLTQNQTCLIHSASGAVGLAAIQYCRLMGAKVIATAGTDEKRMFLREKLGIEHVFNSRDLSFVAHVRDVAPQGVDVIINSLTGPLMQQSMNLLATNGHFIELGKRDIYSNNTLPMFSFRKECTWHVVDAFAHHQNHPRMTQTLLRFVVDHLTTGQLKPIEPLMVFERNRIVEAFTLFQRAAHIGKLVLQISPNENRPDLSSTTNVTETAIQSYSSE